MFRSIREVSCRMPRELCVWRAELSGGEQVIYDALLEAMSEKKTEVTVPWFFGADPGRILNAVSRDQPMLFFVDFGKTVWTNSSIGSTTVRWEPRMGPAEADIMIRRLDRKLRQLRLPSGGTQLQRELCVHNLLPRLNVVSAPGSGTWEDHTIVGPLLLGHTVCEGMTRLFCLLCAMCGVEARYVSGTASNALEKGPHAWNIVRLGSTYAHVDAYWDAHIGLCRGRYFAYDYFNLDDRAMRLDHSWDEEKYPACTDRYSYFRLCGAEVQDMEALETLSIPRIVPWQKGDTRGYLQARVRGSVDAGRLTEVLQKRYRSFAPARFFYTYRDAQGVVEVALREEQDG
ncbi:MAG: hypothetical protein IJH78_00200 [Clostridia bacterium]|nr:hypothetical protein [Clostridia bacterium]